MGRTTGNGEVPGNERNSHTDRLLDGKDSTVRRSWCLNCSLNTFGLASKPPGETQGIVKLALSFKERLSGLVSDDVGQVITVVADQLVPLEEALGTNSRVDFAEGLEGLVCGFDCWVGIFCDAVWCRCPYFAVAWVYRGYC